MEAVKISSLKLILRKLEHWVSFADGARPQGSDVSTLGQAAARSGATGEGGGAEAGAAIAVQGPGARRRARQGARAQHPRAARELRRRSAGSARPGAAVERLMTPGCVPPSWWRLLSSISRRRSIPRRGCCRSCAARAIKKGEGATAYLSPRTVAAIAAWTEAAEITAGPLFRRVQVRRYKARAAVRGRPIDSISGRRDVGSAQDALQAGREGADRI
jgi:hypothetical protein